MRKTALVLVAVAGGLALSTCSPRDLLADQRALKAGGAVNIERVPEADQYFRLLEVNALLFRYTGGLIDCWLEETVASKPNPKVVRLSDELRKTLISAQVGQGGAASGFLLLTRRKVEGNELWDVKLTIDRPGKGALGVKLTGVKFALAGKLQSFTVAEKSGEVVGETELLSVGEDTPSGRVTVRLKCGPWKGDVK